MKTLIACALFGTLITATAARADDGDDYRFKLVNKSSSDAIQFYTMRRDGKWSGDWLSTPIKPGQMRPMHFNEKDDRCKVRTRVVFADSSEFDTPVDYCGTSQVILTDKTLLVQ